ncbi:MAG: hypothetical protein SPD11_10495 [Sphaerochaetaceae bacterium]|nr:hypothetical protein [Sphaerochaetaceae bacterium]
MEMQQPFLTSHVNSLAILEEKRWLNRSEQENVIVEIYKLLCQTRNLVQLKLNRMRAERRKGLW